MGWQSLWVQVDRSPTCGMGVAVRSPDLPIALRQNDIGLIGQSGAVATAPDRWSRSSFAASIHLPSPAFDARLEILERFRQDVPPVNAVDHTACFRPSVLVDQECRQRPRRARIPPGADRRTCRSHVARMSWHLLTWPVSRSTQDNENRTSASSWGHPSDRGSGVVWPHRSLFSIAQRAECQEYASLVGVELERTRDVLVDAWRQVVFLAIESPFEGGCAWRPRVCRDHPVLDHSGIHDPDLPRWRRRVGSAGAKRAGRSRRCAPDVCGCGPPAPAGRRPRKSRAPSEQ